MNDSIREKHNRAVSINNAAYQQCLADYQAAQATGDQDAEDTAIQNMAALRSQRQQIDAMANEAMAPAARFPGQENMSKRDVDLCRHYGLSPDDLATAKSWTNDPRVSDVERVETYLRNQQRYRAERASGRYVDEGDLNGDRRRGR
jgi:hypothetical protein